MCNPAAIGVGVGMGGLNLFASYQQGKMAQQMAKLNASFQRKQAEQALVIGADNMSERLREVDERVADQRAEIAANGFDVNVGAALGIQEKTRILGAADAMRIRANAINEYQSGMTQAELTLLGGQQARRSALLQGITGAASGGLGSGAAVYGFTK